MKKNTRERERDRETRCVCQMKLQRPWYSCRDVSFVTYLNFLLAIEITNLLLARIVNHHAREREQERETVKTRISWQHHLAKSPHAHAFIHTLLIRVSFSLAPPCFLSHSLMPDVVPALCAASPLYMYSIYIPPIAPRRFLKKITVYTHHENKLSWLQT